MSMTAWRYRHSRRRAMLAAAAATVAYRLPAFAEGTPQPAEWMVAAQLELPRSEYPATVLDGKIYVAGGFGAESSFDRYDPEADAWERLPDLPEPRHHLALAGLDGAIYLAGGLTGISHSAEANFWRFDPEALAWESLEPLPQGPRGSLGAGVIDGVLYVVGGSANDLSGPATSDLARYDPVEARWDLLEPMPTAREHVGVGVAAGMVIAVGGRDGGHETTEMLEATERYDPASGTWSVGTPMPTRRAGLGVASGGDAIFAVGGERFLDGEAVTLAAVERYDPVSDAWTQLPDLPVARHGVAAAWVDQSLYAIGGSIAAGTVMNVRTVDRIQAE